MSAIVVEELSKHYRLGMIGGGTLREDLHRWWCLIRGKPDPLIPVGAEGRPGSREGHIWALRGVSFEVGVGEVVGLIGRNGAGKSTLLKVLSRITAPTAGRALLRGRVGSLLEVGTGFHQELTGRENVYLNGAILGMTRTEIDRKFDAIVEFSGVEPFIDTPVKRYSSGMRVRLAFAVAAHLEPEIMLVDEVLAVGDAAFQKRCIGKMGEVAEEGRTVIFVSHDMSAIASLCERTILLEDGRILADGPTSSTIDAYLAASIESGERTGEMRWDRPSGDDRFRLHAIRTVSDEGAVRADFKNSEPLTVEIEFERAREIPYLKIGFEVRTPAGTPVFQSFHNDVEERLPAEPAPGREVLRAAIPAWILNGGAYEVCPCIGIHRERWLIRGDRGLTVNVVYDVPNPDYVVRDRPGHVAPLLEWRAGEVE